MKIQCDNSNYVEIFDNYTYLVYGLNLFSEPISYIEYKYSRYPIIVA